jgi:Zinc finger, C2H2 type
MIIRGSKLDHVQCFHVADAMLSSSPMAMPSAADLYAELSRADLARLGLVCPADLARLKARKQRPKKYRCPHCNVAFSNNGQLRGHIRIHTGEYSYLHCIQFFW